MHSISIRYVPETIVFIITIGILLSINTFLPRPMLLAERFYESAGIIESFLLGFYAAFLYSKMKNPSISAKWRNISWFFFSIVFFTQFILGLFVSEIFLMTGKVHIPVPALILSGPIYRYEIGFMTILFLSTIILTGPAWCSHLCYFGAIDNSISDVKKGRRIFSIKKKTTLKLLFLSIAIIVPILLSAYYIAIFAIAILSAVAFGIIGLLVIIVFSFRSKKMIHCTL
jgi:ferredoxin-type protein NapH